MELLVAMAISLIILLALLEMTAATTKVWQRVIETSANRENARLLLQLMGRDLETAVFPVDALTSSLHFQVNPNSLNGSTYLNPSAAFWQADLSGTTATNGDVQDVGYFVNWVPDATGVVHGTFCRIQVPRPATNSAIPSLIITPEVLTTFAPGLANTDITSASAYQGLLADGVMGLWITLYSTAAPPGNVLPAVYDSRTDPTLPAYADIGIAMVDSAEANRITTANLSSITNLYSNPACTNAASFIELLPKTIRAGAQSFTTRVPLRNVAP